MEYALPPLTTCTVYLHMICCILTQCVTHTQSHTARPSCKTMHVTQLYVNHQCLNQPCSQAPNQLQLSVGTASDQKTDATQLLYTLPIPSLAKQLHKQYNLYRAII